MRFRSWWLYFLFLVLLLMLAGLGAGSYLLYHQERALADISQDTRLLMLRTERLESLVQEQETRALIAQREEEARLAMEQQKAAQETREAKTASATTESPAAEKTGEAAGQVPADQPAEMPKPLLPAEPTSSDRVDIGNVEVNGKGSEVKIGFDVINLSDPNDPALGYVTVVARAERGGKPWIEAWPPMRLTPLGRPLNYRRGTPFSVQRYRRLQARFAKGDKEFQRLEFLVYSREGDIMMVRSQELGAAPAGENGG